MVAVPKGAKVPEDRKSPAQIDAEDIPTIDVEWRGHTFTVMSDPDDYPVAIVQAFERGQNLTGLEQLFGIEQWQVFLKTKPTKRDATSLLEAMGEILGTGE